MSCLNTSSRGFLFSFCNSCYKSHKFWRVNYLAGAAVAPAPAAFAPCAAAISDSFFLASNSFCILPPCFVNFRVGENSPRRCPTISSVIKTAVCSLPLCTPNVKPTISGEIWLSRDHVLITPTASGFFPVNFFKSFGSI